MAGIHAINRVRDLGIYLGMRQEDASAGRHIEPSDLKRALQYHLGEVVAAIKDEPPMIDAFKIFRAYMVYETKRPVTQNSLTTMLARAQAFSVQLRQIEETEKRLSAAKNGQAVEANRTDDSQKTASLQLVS